MKSDYTYIISASSDPSEVGQVIVTKHETTERSESRLKALSSLYHCEIVCVLAGRAIVARAIPLPFEGSRIEYPARPIAKRHFAKKR